MPRLGSAIAVGTRASYVLEGLARRTAASGRGLRAARLGLSPDSSACGLVGSMASLISDLPGDGSLLIIVDGYSDRSVGAARLLLEMWGRRSGSAALVFALPPLPYEKRLEAKFRFNVGLLANSLGSGGLLVRVGLGDRMLEAPAEDFERAALDEMSAVLADIVARSDRPPLSEFLEAGGRFSLVVGGFSSAEDLALAGALEGAPSVAVAASSASSLLTAASLAQALGVGVDVAGGTVSYLITRRDDLGDEDPIHAALRGRSGGGVPVLDPSPSVPARVDLPLDLYRL
jgi:hypothetical protein